PRDQSLPSNQIFKLLAARDGTVWIGTAKGLASWKNGKLTRYSELAGLSIPALIEDHAGSIWAGGVGIPAGKLCEIRGDNIQCSGADGGLGNGVHSLVEDSKGRLWAGVVDGLWRWRPGPVKFYSVPGQMDGISALAEDAGGDIVVGTRSGIRRVLDQAIE